jgi:hypothetical protein
MAEGVEHKFTTEQKVFLIKSFYETNNKSETCRRFSKKLNRQTTRETLGDIVKRFEENEPVFKLNGHVNRHNSIYWASENPRIDLERDLNVPGISVWVGLSSYGVIDPFFFNSIVTDASCVQMLRDQFQPVIADWPDISDFWFQHDSSSVHYSQIACDYLEEMFPDRWIGRRGAVEWPPRSPELYKKVCRSMEFRLHKCIEANGWHFEQDY